jgi:uncharacterized protein YjbK
MRKEIEEEFKYLVPREQYQMLLSKCIERYPFIRYGLHVNYYYDTEDGTLNKAKTTVRIRQQNEKMSLQIKKHIKSNNGLSTSDEYCKRINMLPYALRIPNVPYNLYMRGVLITERKTFSFGKNSFICFDSNTYLGTCDYEVEIEVDKADKNDVLAVIKYLKIDKKPIESKSERFFDRLTTINNKKTDTVVMKCL